MAYVNRIRLPFKLTRPQFPEERESIRKANGETKTLSVVVRKVYEGETDYWPERWHERFKIALAHDNVTVEGEKYVGLIAQDGEYTIEWPDFLDYPTGKGAFKAEVTPFNNSNSNCQTCEEATQVTLADDTVTGIYGALQADTAYEWPLADNDTICCYPATFELMSFNSDYIASASVDSATGVLTFTTQATFVDANEVVIGTYRVTCPNGGYDEADIYASFGGSEEGCLAPTEVTEGATTTTTIGFSWTAPVGGSVDYEWEIYEGDGPIGSPVQTGNVTTSDPTDPLVITGLTENTEYYFRVRTACESSSSNYAATTGNTDVEADTCGRYNVAFDDGTGNPANSRMVAYRDCDGIYTSQVVFNLSAIIICAYQTAPGSPALISGGPGTTVTYLTSC